MSLTSQISDVVVAIATEFKNDRADIGDLASLATTVKTSLVEAINELAGEVASGGGAVINDTAPSTTSVYSSTKTEAVAAAAAAAIISDVATATGTVWSSQKTSDQITAAINALINGASASFDTLKELADAIASDETGIADLTTSLGNRLRFDAAQTLTSPQKTQGLANLGAVASADVGDTTTNFVTVFDAALA